MRLFSKSFACGIALGLAWSGSALSDENCPTADDLNSGLVFVSHGKKLNILKLRKQIAPNIILEGSYFSSEDGPSLLKRYYAGFFDMAFTNFRVTGRTTYEPEVETLMPLRDGMRYDFTFEGGDVLSETEAVIEIVDAEAQVSVKGCDYDAIKFYVHQTMTSKTGQVFSGSHDYIYLPELMYSVIGFDVDNLSVRRMTDDDPTLKNF